MKTQSNAMARTAIDSMMKCHQMCEEQMMACLQRGGEHAQQAHMMLMMDCADMCRMTADMMMRGSEMAAKMCEMCADLCMRNAENCERMGDAECAAMCRECAEACRKMAGSMAR